MKRLFLSALLLCLLATSAFAGVDDYPTSISGCQRCDSKGDPYGPIFTGDLKDATQDSLIDPWRLYNRECTSFCAWRLQSRNGYVIAGAYGNAQDWGGHAKSDHYTVDMNPAIGAIAWWYYSAKSGHVAWVEAINGSSITVEEYNKDYTGHYKEEVINANSVSGYIHFKDIQPASGSDLYVSASRGVDASNRGSSTAPFSTVTYAVSQVVAGPQTYTIHIEHGNYGGNFNTGNKKITFVTWNGGPVNIGG